MAFGEAHARRANLFFGTAPDYRIRADGTWDQVECIDANIWPGPGLLTSSAKFAECWAANRLPSNAAAG